MLLGIIREQCSQNSLTCFTAEKQLKAKREDENIFHSCDSTTYVTTLCENEQRQFKLCIWPVSLMVFFL